MPCPAAERLLCPQTMRQPAAIVYLRVAFRMRAPPTTSPFRRQREHATPPSRPRVALRCKTPASVTPLTRPRPFKSGATLRPAWRRWSPLRFGRPPTGPPPFQTMGETQHALQRELRNTPRLKEPIRSGCLEASRPHPGVGSSLPTLRSRSSAHWAVKLFFLGGSKPVRQPFPLPLLLQSCRSGSWLTFTHNGGVVLCGSFRSELISRQPVLWSTCLSVFDFL